MIKLQDKKNTTLINKQIPVLATQHFDIVWRKPLAYYRDKQREVIDKVLDIIDEYPDFHFALQQANVLRYYVEHNPENFKRLKEAVDKSQIEIVGGLEAIPDVNIPCGESIVRNILYGRQWIKSVFGVEPKVATMLDAFGSSGQLPQILAKMGYKAFLSGRMPGANFPQTGVTSLFLWKGIDGSDIAGVNCDYVSIPQANLGSWYGWGILEGFDKEYANSPLLPEVFINDIVDGLKNFSLVGGYEKNIVAVISGEEHLPRIELITALNKYNEGSSKAVLSRFDDFVEKADWSNVDRLEGEYNVEFSGCYTTRIELKQLSLMAEEKLYSDEFIRSIAVMNGLEFNGLSKIDDMWRNLAFCQFHDAICGCHIDENYKHIIDAFSDILGKIDADVSCMLGFESDEVASKNISVVNVNPFETLEVVKIDTGGKEVCDSSGNLLPSQIDGDKTLILTNVKAGSIESYKLSEVNSPLPISLEGISQDGIRVGRFIVAENMGDIKVEDAITGQHVFEGGKVGGRLILKQENGTLWTENYTGVIVKENSVKSKLESIELGDICLKISYCGEFQTSEIQWSSFKVLKWRKIIYVHRCIDRIDVDIDLFYEGKETEVCVEFDCDIDVDNSQARYEIPFGSLIREPYNDGDYKLGRGNWPALSWLNYQDKDKGLAFVHTGTPGCVAKDGKVSFSLLRSATDYNEPLFPAKPEEKSFNNGCHNYQFAIIPHCSEDIQWLSQARAFSHRPIIGLNSDKVALLGNFGIKINAENVYLSSLKPAEDGNGVVARVYEVIGKGTDFFLTLENAKCRIVETSMDELIDFASDINGSVYIKPYEIKTFRLIPE